MHMEYAKKLKNKNQEMSRTMALSSAAPFTLVFSDI